jgi:hypothetical protein
MRMGEWIRPGCDGGKSEKEKGKIKGKKKIKEKIEIRNKKEKGGGHIDFSSSHPHYTARRSCFAKRFSKTDSAPPQNPLHQHRHNRSCHSHNRSPAKRTLPRRTFAGFPLRVLCSISILLSCSAVPFPILLPTALLSVNT